MPTGPNGEKRSNSPVTSAMHAMRIATGDVEEDPKVLERKRAKRAVPPTK